LVLGQQPFTLARLDLQLGLKTIDQLLLDFRATDDKLRGLDGFGSLRLGRGKLGGLFGSAGIEGSGGALQRFPLGLQLLLCLAAGVLVFGEPVPNWLRIFSTVGRSPMATIASAAWLTCSWVIPRGIWCLRVGLPALLLLHRR
jgi:hypothetical protein